MKSLPIDASNLMEIINKHCRLKILNLSRKQRYIKARIMFSCLLKEKGYGCLAIGKMLNKTHATVLNYFNSIEWFLKVDTKFAKSYEHISKQFHSNSMVYTDLTTLELKKELLLLQKENKLLYLRNLELKDKVYKVTENVI